MLWSTGRSIAPTMTGSAFEECRFRAATCLFWGWGSGPSYLSSPPHAVGACAGGSAICHLDSFVLTRPSSQPLMLSSRTYLTIRQEKCYLGRIRIGHVWLG